MAFQPGSGGDAGAGAGVGLYRAAAELIGGKGSSPRLFVTGACIQVLPHFPC